MRITTIGIAAILAASITPAVSAEEQRGVSLVVGHGLRSCDEWTSSHRTDEIDYAVKVSWLAGFLSGVSSALALQSEDANLLAHMDFSHAIRWVDVVCRQNPAKPVSWAGQALVVELLKRNYSIGG